MTDKTQRPIAPTLPEIVAELDALHQRSDADDAVDSRARQAAASDEDPKPPRAA